MSDQEDETDGDGSAAVDADGLSIGDRIGAGARTTRDRIDGLLERVGDSLQPVVAAADEYCKPVLVNRWVTVATVLVVLGVVGAGGYVAISQTLSQEFATATVATLVLLGGVLVGLSVAARAWGGRGSTAYW